MICGVSYNVFNGEEHLLHSIKQIRSCVDFVGLVAQRVSNLGNLADPSLESIIDTAIRSGLADKVTWYTPDLAAPPVMNELHKRNIGLNDAKSAGVTHFMTMDCDEYYDSKEFLAAIDFIRDCRIKATSVRTYLHIHRPIWRSRLPDNTCCSFLSEIDAKSVITLNSPYPTFIDGTRGINGNGRPFHFFDEHIIAMKHMNLVRKSIDSKLSNSSNAGMIDFINNVRTIYNQWTPGETLNFPGKPPMEIIEVPDIFNIDAIFQTNEKAAKNP
ncbi:hypothetical protein GCM10027046_10480 [Uliginosibacterium flavum]|uniref:Glycosyltransferase 2-like domain-containing protein n=1 Tax=Uliginosibacterium flavum TaxID=1396831 RepID=A0ABV2TR28_9RHOO